MRIEPYLFFNGRCEEALDFYRRALGAKVGRLIRLKDSPEPPPGGVAPGTEDKILHADFQVGETRVLASDGECSGALDFDGFSLALTAATDAEAERLFAGLSDGGTVRVPLSKTFFSSKFGMVADRFGVGWMVMVEK